ncbi:MAG TPA: sensor histidine kinase [Rhizomicrobium sp.]|nr:sensor histidine kinase [Rhizomicrobium sp.]
MAIASKIRTLIQTKIAPRFNSLAARLIAAAAIWTIAGLLIGGFLLSGLFRDSVQGDFDSRLKFDLDGMIAAAETNRDGLVTMRGRFTDPRFERIYSGWYWQITPQKPPADAGQGVSITPQISRSLWDRSLKLTDETRNGNLVWGRAIGPEGQNLRVLSQHVEFPISATARTDDTRGYTFMVAGDVAEIKEEVSQFNGTLFGSFVVLGLGLIAAIFIQVRVGLLPLRKVSQSLARIRDGRARRLDGDFPAEIAPLATELNSLIEHSAEVVGRARTHVSNLAHYLKTPLTVLSSEADAQPGPLADAVKRQVKIMRRQVDHYLARARAAGAVNALGSNTPVKPVLEDIARVLTRIHASRSVVISVDCAPGLCFRGEREDLEEMTGNLIDNACKWAREHVEVRAEHSSTKMLTLIVGDDGPGLEAQDRERVVERGERLDESVPGSGLGLAIVRDVAKLYGGEITLDRSPLGGLEARLSLPAVA